MTRDRQFVAPVERLLQLRMLPALDRLPPVFLGAIAQRTRERLFRQGALLLDPLRPVGAAYLVVEGRVAVGTDGEQRPAVGAGTAVGFLELLARIERGIEARALSDTLTLELDWDAHLDLCDDHFAILHTYLQFLAGRLVSEMTVIPAGTGPGATPASRLAADGTLDLVQRVLALGNDAAFSTSSLDAIAELARHAVAVRYGAGDNLWSRGEAAAGFVLVTAGSVRCVLQDGQSRHAEPTVALGLHEALAGLPHWFDATAASPVSGLEIHVDPLLDILEDHLELGMDLMSKLARQLLGV
ncbi:MAG: hypothetical protein AMS18_05205 [Gemmatimonas sp. SG8_17]|nr:MAG: hypothetical protein AMS18_05205 [Gemmatimonas sp. SG8_17]